MVLEVKVEVVHKETIKPSSPTPHHLRFFSLSIFDQLSFPLNIPLLLFYPNNNDHYEVNNVDQQHPLVVKTQLLKSSLSEALTRFYQFAGRVLDNASVCCNDQGVMFLEAQVTCSLSRVLDKPDPELLKKLIPVGSTKRDTGYELLLVQVNFFECGGTAIGFNASHKIIDACTLSTFVNCWAANSIRLSASDNGVAVHQLHNVAAASVFPPLDLFSSPPPIWEFSVAKCTTRRFLFESSKIARLKSEAVSAAVQYPTRVEVVSALIWKCAMQASRANSDGRRLPSALCQIVNMRNILAHPSAKYLMGNLVGFFVAESTGAESDDIQGLVAKMRKGYEEFKENYSTKDVSVDDIRELLTKFGKLMEKDDIECYHPTSWCRLPFHEANFGWGKPLMSIPSTEEFKNSILLTDRFDGDGIEARLTLKEEDMAIFENNEELLAYASPNPSIT